MNEEFRIQSTDFRLIRLDYIVFLSSFICTLNSLPVLPLKFHQLFYFPP